MSESLTIYKLIVLYMLRHVKFPLTNAQISEFILGKEYMTYFTLQTVLSELTESGLLHAESRGNSSYYTLTPSGEKTLFYFKNRIPGTFRDEIDEYMKQNQVKLKDEVSVQADYYKNTAYTHVTRTRLYGIITVGKAYVVALRTRNRKQYMHRVKNEAQAKAVCLNWSRECQPLYEYIMKKLL